MTAVQAKTNGNRDVLVLDGTTAERSAADITAERLVALVTGAEE